MPAPQFGKPSTAHDDKTTMQDLGAASRFTTQPLGESSRKKRETLQHCHQKRKIRYASIILARSCQCPLYWRRLGWPPARHCGCGSIASSLAEIAWGVESRWAARWLTRSEEHTSELQS